MNMGADLFKPDPTGATALHHIASQSLQARRALLPYYVGPEVDEEFQSGCIRIWKRLLDMGGDLNARHNEGAPPLFRYLLARDSRSGDSCHVDNFPRFFATADTNARNKEKIRYM
jgi:ankyrin repeat protein